MTVLTQPPTMGDALKYEVNPNYTRETVTLVAGTAYPVGSVLGRITASGKYKLATSGGTDGAQTAAAVLLYAVDATLSDAEGIVFTGGQPLRDDMRRAFPFAGMMFEEYNGSVTLSNGSSERLIPAGEGIAFPLGTFDTFTTYGGPANLLETANTVGLPLYARQQMDTKGRWIDLMTEASILPVNKRPRLAVRLFSSN